MWRGEAHPRIHRTALWQGAAVFDHFLKKTLISKKLMSVFFNVSKFLTIT